MISNDYFIVKDLVENSKKKYNNILLKKSRVKKWLYFHKKILFLHNNYSSKSFYLYYATFTFKNEKLNENDFKRKSFTKYLKENNVLSYLLNKDYGDLNQRIHLHGFLLSNKKLNNYSLDHYGFTKLSDISLLREEEEEVIINYITNYVIKNDYFSNKMLTSYYEGSIF